MLARLPNRSLVVSSVILFLVFFMPFAEGLAQNTIPPDTASPRQETPVLPSANPDAANVVVRPVRPRTPAQLEDAAWEILTTAVSDAKHPDTRVQALAALGLLDNHPRSQKLIEAGMLDPDIDVRTAAVLAAGQTGSSSITSAMRRLLNDKEPQVAFGAALSLWKMGDRSGEDILMAVIDGERRASATIINSTEHAINRDLHSPVALAKIGALQASGMLLGPWGFGITAYEYIRKNGGDTARVNAIEAIAQQKTEPIRKNLLGALADKDPAVRAAAVQALGSYHDVKTATAIAALFDDPKAPVRYTAAAAYLVSSGKSQGSPTPGTKATRRYAPPRTGQIH